MKNLFKNPLFYTNILLLALVMALAANTNITYAKFSSWISQTFAAVGPITGEGTVNFFTAFAGGSNQIGDSAIYQDAGGHIGIGTGASTFDSRLEILSSIDRFIELIRSGATYPTVFRQGTDGVLVVNNSNIDTLTLKGGNVGIGITGPRSSLEIAKSIAHTYPTPGLTYGSLHISDVGTAGNSGSITFGSPDNDSPHAGIYVQGSGAYGTKMYFGTTDAYTTGSKVRMMIDHLGNVGIGTTNPGAKLHVSGDGAEFRLTGGTYTSATIYDGGTGDPGYFRAYYNGSIDAQVGANGTYFAATGGNVGIGTASPGAKLEVSGQIKITGGTPGAGKVLTSDASGLATWGTPSGSLPSGTSGQTLRNDGTGWVANSILFNNGTNVGIGTTGPGSKLHLTGSTGGATGLSFNSGTDNTWQIGTGVGTLSTANSFQIYNQTQNIGVITFKNDGNVGIGTAGPVTKLDVSGAVNVGNAQSVTWGGTGGPSVTGNASVGSLSFFSNTTAMTIIAGGNVGIGTASPQAPLHVNGAMMLTPLDADPASPVSGMIWLRQ